MFDCISDVSHKEQMPHVLKYVPISNISNDISNEETFIDFINNHKKTVEGLALKIIEKLKKEYLKLDHFKSQFLLCRQHIWKT